VRASSAFIVNRLIRPKMFRYIEIEAPEVHLLYGV
jgi:hypothetical protein